MLDPESAWIDEFKKLKPASSAAAGIANLASAIEKLTNKVEPKVPGGVVSPGIFKWNKAAFIAKAMSLAPTPGPEWGVTLAGAWAAGCNTGVITPGLVTASSIWAVSQADINTLPATAATVPTVALGQAAIISILATMPAVMASTPEKGIELQAKAFRAGVLAFTFVLTGLAGTPPTPVPLSLTVPAN